MWPISNVTPDEVNTALREAKEQGSSPFTTSEGASRQSTSQDNDGSEQVRKKRTRTRTRKRKPTGDSDGRMVKASPQQQEPNHPRIIREAQDNMPQNDVPSQVPNDSSVLSIR